MQWGAGTSLGGPGSCRTRDGHEGEEPAMVGHGDQRPHAIRMEAGESEGWQEARGSKKGQVVPESRDTYKVKLSEWTQLSPCHGHRGVRQEGA